MQRFESMQNFLKKKTQMLQRRMWLKGKSASKNRKTLLLQVEEGYEFTYTPTAPGDYLITIKYAGNTHIPGSPFKARITGSKT